MLSQRNVAVTTFIALFIAISTLTAAAQTSGSRSASLDSNRVRSKTGLVEPGPSIILDTGTGSISLTTIGSPVTENFDTLSNTAGSTTNTALPTGWYITESGGGARDNEQYAVDTGVSTTGDTYSYGAAAATERALGGLRSGTLIPVIGAKLTNNTGATISSLAISYNGEEWRLGTTGRTDQINFEYSLDATDLTTGTWTGVTALNFVTPNSAVTAGALDGNAAANRTAKTGSITGLSIPNGATFFIRFTDTDATGADDGLAIDDFSITPSIATAGEVSLSGRVLTANGQGVKNAMITVSGNGTASRLQVLTGPFGYYQFEGLAAGETYVVTVNSKSFTFAQPSRIVTLNDNLGDADFIADPQ